MSAFTANRLVLERRFPEAARLLDANAGNAPPCHVESARNAEPTMRLAPDGPYLHSRFDPGREGRKLATAVPESAGYVVLWAPGLFYEVESLLERKTISRILLVEPEVSFLRQAFAARDLTAVLSDARVHLLCGGEADPTRVAEFVADTYLPVLHGTFKLETARPRANEAAETVAAIHGAAQSQVDDMGVQRRFGVRWFSNAVRNLLTLPATSVELPRPERVVVAAAGPSLEEEISRLDGSIPLIATDTTLPALVRHGVRPAAVVSLDCQQISYHHFLSSRGTGADIDRSYPLIADLSSAPTVFRAHPTSVFTTTNYPLARMLRARFPEVAFVDGGGGNVTQAALSLADALGAREVYLVGADLSYPRGKPYARETYLYSYFRSRETRFEPTYTRLFDLVLSDPATRAETRNGKRVYFTPRLDEYRRRLKGFVASLATEVRFGGPRTNEPLAQTGAERNAPPRDTPLRVLSVPSLEGRRAFLTDYLARLEAATLPEEPAGHGLYRMSHELREIWITLLPTAAAFLGTDLDARRTTEALSESRRWALHTLARALASVA